MLRTVSDQPSLWEALLPAELLVLPTELARVDALLDDPVFFAPFVAFFDERLGRPSIPMETYLRMMFLKLSYQLSFQSVCREVADSISWQRFCRISFGSRVPHLTARPGWSPRPESGSPVTPPTARPGWSVGTIPTPAPSRKAGSGNRSSSG